MGYYDSISNVVDRYGDYHQYPVGSQDGDLEGAHKRFASFSSPMAIFDRATVLLDRLVGREVVDTLRDPEYLNRTVTSVFAHFEQKYSTALSPTFKNETFDSTKTLRESNNNLFFNLTRFPATHIESVAVVFPHAESSASTFDFKIPPHWVALKNNTVKIMPDFGFYPHMPSGSPVLNTIAPMFRSLPTKAHQPSKWYVKYRYGFDHERYPANLVESLELRCIVKILREMASMLLPTNSVSTSIDGVSQSANTPGQDLLLGKADLLERQAKEMEDSLMGEYAQSMILDFID